MPTRRIPGRGRSSQPRRMDAGGARMRAQQFQEAHEREMEKNEADYKRVAKAAGRIPVVQTVKDLTAYTSEVKDVLSRDYVLSFPAIQVGKKLSIEEIFGALKQNFGNSPDVKAVRFNETSVGPHFDDYYRGGMRPWVLHENHTGTGIIRATFLPGRQYEAYLGLAKALPETDETDEFLAQTRASIGSIALSSSSDYQTYKGDIKPGTRTLIWQGGNGRPPAVHDIQRNEPGDYIIYAGHVEGELAAGFEKI